MQKKAADDAGEIQPWLSDIDEVERVLCALFCEFVLKQYDKQTLENETEGALLDDAIKASRVVHL